MSDKWMEAPSGFDDFADKPFDSTGEAEARIEQAAPSLSMTKQWLRYISHTMAAYPKRYRHGNFHFAAEALRDRQDALEDPEHRGVVEANIHTRKAAEADHP
jgi:hypothetical protein